MLSYRHGFHAGNHADIFKHIVLSLVLDYLKKKPTPILYFDSHAGAGLYDLDSDFAKKTEEAKNGCELLKKLEDSTLSTLPKACKDYFKLVEDFQKNCNCYPGSPCLAHNFCREQDFLVLCELHSTEVEVLKKNLKTVELSKISKADKSFFKGSQVNIHHRDGFEALVSLLPPTKKSNSPTRGIVLVDPSYELETDYEKTVSSVCRALKKWSAGVFIVWYPLILRRLTEVTKLKNELADYCKKNSVEFINAEFCIRKPGTQISDEHTSSLYGSGVFVIKPTWQLAQDIKLSMNSIKHLWQDSSLIIEETE